MESYHGPVDWEALTRELVGVSHGPSAWRLSILLMGIPFGHGRRVVATRIRSAAVGDDYQDDYDLLQSVGRDWRLLG
ncbi:MAG: hypothetical protein KDA80_03305 [Planctomycetaceae bacterium]|nr:hypothetical protein [Planctomycetaceae bacterium]